MAELFQFDFMRRAVVAGIVIAVTAPMVGMFLVVRRYSLMADTLAHVSLMGVAIGLLSGIHPVATAAAVTVVAAVGIDRLRSSRKMFGESVLALFLSGSLAVSAVLLSISKGFNANLLSILFGSIATVSPSDLMMIVILAVVSAAVIVALYKELFLVAFDEDLARANGLPVDGCNAALMVVSAITVAVAMRVVGVLLIGALMVIPVMSAALYGYSFKHTLLLAIAFSLISVASGLLISTAFDLAVGGTIVVVALLVFAFSLFLNRGD